MLIMLSNNEKGYIDFVNHSKKFPYFGLSENGIRYILQTYPETVKYITNEISNELIVEAFNDIKIGKKLPALIRGISLSESGMKTLLTNKNVVIDSIRRLKYMSDFLSRFLIDFVDDETFLELVDLDYETIKRCRIMIYKKEFRKKIDDYIKLKYE